MRIILLFFGDYAQKYALYKRRFNVGIMLQMFSTWSCPLPGIKCHLVLAVLLFVGAHASSRLVFVSS